MHGWEFMPWGWFGFILQIIFWVAVILLIVWLANKLREPKSEDRSSSGDTALDILQKRYARGEIDKKEYEEKKKDLTG